MRNLKSYWFDQDNMVWLTQPHILIRAAELATSIQRIKSDAALWNQIGTRKVSYMHPTEGRINMELIPYIHPTGAATITIGTITTAGDGSQTYTPSQEGRFLDTSGVLLPAGATPVNSETVEGGLLTDYYLHFDLDDNGVGYGGLETGRAVTIEAGDFLWLVRRGKFEADFSAAVTAGEPVVSSTGTAGEVRSAVAINTVGTIAQYHTTLLERTLGRGFKALGHALETLGGAGLGWILLDLPYKPFRTT